MLGSLTASTRLGSASELVERRGDTAPTAPALQGEWLGYAEFADATRTHLKSVEPEGCVAILVVAIDYFEALTSLHGGSVGNEILSAVASRIREAVRPYDVVARVDGSGFAMVWRQQVVDLVPADIGSRIANQFDSAVSTAVGELTVSVTVGVSTVMGDEVASADPPTLLAQARAAVLAARNQQGRSKFSEFNPIMLEQAVEAYTTEHQLRTALREDSLSVNYQPIVSLRTGQAVGLEALARWEDAVYGSVSPARFIPVAEDSGLINHVGSIVLEHSIPESARWNAGRPGGLVLTVNLSNHQLLDPHLIPTIKRLLHDNQLEPGLLCLEITESVVMANVAASMTILCQLKDLGVMVAIDDFGTGYSSLSYLRRLPVDILKIDRSFIQSIQNRDDRIITKAIIDLAHTLGMTTVAEGVERRDQLATLVDFECDMVQGFLFHHPAKAVDVDLTGHDIVGLIDLDLTE